MHEERTAKKIYMSSQNVYSPTHDKVINIVVLGNSEDAQSNLVRTFGGPDTAVHGDVVKKRVWHKRLGMRIKYFMWRLVDPHSHYFQTADVFVLLIDVMCGYTTSSLLNLCNLVRSKNKSGQMILVQYESAKTVLPVQKLRRDLRDIAATYNLPPPHILNSLDDGTAVDVLFDEVAVICARRVVDDSVNHKQVHIRPSTSSGCNIM